MKQTEQGKFELTPEDAKKIVDFLAIVNDTLLTIEGEDAPLLGVGEEIRSWFRDIDYGQCEHCGCELYEMPKGSWGVGYVCVDCMKILKGGTN